MMRLTKVLALLWLAPLLANCTHVISKDVRGRVDPSLTFREVIQKPEIFRGRWVLWGGEIIETINQKDGTTLLEIIQWPLGWRGEPKETVASEGRFLVAFDKYMDPYVFRRGKKITVGGEIQGERVKPLGQMDYRYPLVLGREVYLWQEYSYYYEPNPHYYPWWGYPYGWNFGILYHRHWHR